LAGRGSLSLLPRVSDAAEHIQKLLANLPNREWLGNIGAKKLSAIDRCESPGNWRAAPYSINLSEKSCLPPRMCRIGFLNCKSPIGPDNSDHNQVLYEYRALE
jgi:hypothetical protein